MEATRGRSSSSLLTLLYNRRVKTWDVIIIGGGIIGLSLSIALRKRGATVLILERGQPGHEASYAAAGMLADFPLEMPSALQPLAAASARLYPEFVHALQDESGMSVDLRDQGTIFFATPEHLREHPRLATDCAVPLQLGELEPALGQVDLPAVYLKESSVDPRALTAASLKAARHRGVDISSGTTASAVLLSNGRATGVGTGKTEYCAPVIVNCAGAWAGQLSPQQFPIRPVKGQMLSLAAASRNLLRHVIRAPEIYLVPRSDGRILAGATVEEAGYDKRTEADTIQRMHRAAIHLVPALAQARMLEAWAGLRPGSPDNLPILGATRTPGYFVATGHFRDGILLTPVTAHVMAQMIIGGELEYDVSAFSPARFES